MTSNVLSVPASRPGLLSDDDLAFYHEQGYLIVREVFRPDEIRRLADDVDRVGRERTDLIDANNMRVRFKNHHETNEVLFEVFDPISDLSQVAWAVAHDPRILARLYDLYGEPGELFKDKLIYKPPGAGGLHLHQDWIAWPDFPESFVTVLLAIDPFTVAGGATEVYPCCHKQGYLSPRDGQHHYVELKDLPTEPVPLVLDPGDIAIFTCFTPHRSGPNLSTESRRGYFISYNARSDGGQQHARHYREFHAWLRSKYPEEKRAALYFR